MAINDLGSPEHNAHLLKYDSVHGKLANQVSSTDKSISIDGNCLINLDQDFKKLQENSLPGMQKITFILHPHYNILFD